MICKPLTRSDLEELKTLQPPDWSDIIPDFEYYLRSGFCNCLKLEVNHQIAATGVAIIYGKTAWLAHIIVKPEFRNRGFGYTIVTRLLDIVSRSRAKSCLLTATALGKPVYEKSGFRSISEYIFMTREKPWQEITVSGNIIDYRDQYRNQIYQLDRKVSGEDRKILLSDFLEDVKLFIVNDMVSGYCIPSLKEGPIIASNAEAGIELMKIKYPVSDKAVIPDENIAAWQFLKSHGFKETETKGTRMILGKNVLWQPLKIFSRAGGNFG